MNETLFRQIAEKDFDSLKALIEKGDFETSEFEFQFRDINASRNLKLYGDIVSAAEVLTPKKSACGWDCKTCTRVHCALVKAVPYEASKIVTSDNFIIQVTSPCL